MYVNPEGTEESAAEAKTEKVCKGKFIMPRELRLREITMRNKKGGNEYQLIGIMKYR